MGRIYFHGLSRDAILPVCRAEFLGFLDSMALRSGAGATSCSAERATVTRPRCQ